MKNLPRLDSDAQNQIDKQYENRLESLQAVDEMVENIVNQLQANEQFDDTYLIFASDNGWHLGEHRTSEKGTAYEESIHMPLGIRGPGIPAGRRTSQVALNIDLAPTFADLAGTTAPDFVDGRSLMPTFSSDAPSWRTAFLEEYWARNAHKSVRTADGKKFIRYNNGEEEYYDLNEDPHELDNAYQALDNAYQAADQSLIDALKSRLDTLELKRRLYALEDCVGKSCRAAEDGSW